jgi:hypothetical protein
VVLVSEDASFEKRLVAYLTLAGAEGVPTASELRSYLKERLPEYMVPSLFVIMDALPLTRSGKIDRRALPAPGAMSAGTTANFVAPRTPVEEVLADIWRDILNLERVSVHDDFFELGGHSLLATRVLSKVRRIFRLELPLQVLFDTHTIAELALALAGFEEKAGQTEKIARVLQKLKGASAEDIRMELDKKRRERISL